MTHTKTSIRNIKPFEEYYEVNSQTKKKNLINAIQIAMKIHKGEMTLIQHYNQCKKQFNEINIDSESENNSHNDRTISSGNKVNSQHIKSKRKRSLNSIKINENVVYKKTANCIKNTLNMNTNTSKKINNISNKHEKERREKNIIINNHKSRKNSFCSLRSANENNYNSKSEKYENNFTLEPSHPNSHDIINIVDNFIYTKKNLQNDQYDEAFNSLKRSIALVRKSESNLNVSIF